MAEVGIGGVRAENAGGKVPPETLYIQLNTHANAHTSSIFIRSGRFWEHERTSMHSLAKINGSAMRNANLEQNRPL